jgi:transposase, IS5 family
LRKARFGSLVGREELPSYWAGVDFSGDARLLNRAREILVRLAQRHGVKLRQSYARVGKFALIKHQRYAHAKHYLGRVIRDISRKIEGNGWLEQMVFGRILPLARQVREQTQRQRGPKVYSLHAPEVECIGKGKAHRPYEFGVKVSVATTGHALATVIPEIEALVGNTIERILAD